MSRAHYVAPGGGALRVSPCGVTCRAGGPLGSETGIERGTSRLIYVRCRECVALLRAMRHTRTRFAAVGDDGMRPVVWGIGTTPEEARQDAAACGARQSADELDIHEITEVQATIVHNGDVSWPIAVPS